MICRCFCFWCLYSFLQECKLLYLPVYSVACISSSKKHSGIILFKIEHSKTLLHTFYKGRYTELYRFNTSFLQCEHRFRCLVARNWGMKKLDYSKYRYSNSIVITLLQYQGCSQLKDLVGLGPRFYWAGKRKFKGVLQKQD